MPADLRALLAAIVADPADDTARLAYADCLQEHGNTARADFIRFQIEAERFHPFSNARARLVDKARGLFAAHWIEWWGEVCTVVGLRRPAAKPGGPIGRLARRIGMTSPPGDPYELFEPTPFLVLPRSRPYNPSLGGWVLSDFQRGFPDKVAVVDCHMNSEKHFLQDWPNVSPLADLAVDGPSDERGIDGPHFQGLRSLSIRVSDGVGLLGALASPHLTRLDSLTIREWNDNTEVSYLDAIDHAFELPLMRQIKRLSISLWCERTAVIVARAHNLAQLEALEVSLYPEVLNAESLMGSEDIEAAGRRISMLARSLYLGNLKELQIVGELSADAIEAVMRNSCWTSLRKLKLLADSPSDVLDLLNATDDLLELEELRLFGVSYTVAQVAAFARSPLLKRLRHFAVRGGPDRSVDFDIAHAVNPDRIETFAIGEKELQTGVAAKSQDRFGDRFRVLS